MRDETVSRNYAETLFELALRNEAVAEYGEALGTVARLLDDDPKFRTFLETPRIADDERKRVLRKVFGSVLPRHVLNFVLVTVDKRRQRLLRDIYRQYEALWDQHVGREHVEVTLARPAEPATERLVAEKLSAMLGKQAVPHYRVRPDIIGGLVVRTGNTIYDGSVRRRLEGLRRRLLSARLEPRALADGSA
ncbi:MAG TPA: ATP synthase F1 subunit delta [Longimicrobiales bacterium]|nr:ATP synthase F1 subunit delta [Longimicrobiales bacterium]